MDGLEELIEASNYREQIWTMPQVEREAQGRCLAGMRLVKVSFIPPSEESKRMGNESTVKEKSIENEELAFPSQKVPTGKRQLYLTFVRWRREKDLSGDTIQATPSTPLPYNHPNFSSGEKDSIPNTMTRSVPEEVRKRSLLDFQFGIGDHVILSEGRHSGMINGLVVDLSSNFIVIVCHRPFIRVPPRERDPPAPTSQRFSPIASKFKSVGSCDDIEELGSSCLPQSQSNVHPDFFHRSAMKVRWKIDRDLVQSGFNTLKGNIVQLLHRNRWADMMRKLIIELESPVFTSHQFSQEEKNMITSMSLNEDQLAAVRRSMEAQHYSLILGMPGTGKSKATVALIQLLLKKGQTVLLTASTHSALDGLLLQLLDLGVEFLRLGQPQMVHSRIRTFTLFDSPDLKTPEDFEKMLGSGPRWQLVAATCAGVHHPILHSRHFDYCIVDESSQVTLPMCLGPVAFASKFILIGDFYQLPPVVQNPEAFKGGLSESLFKILAEAHPHSISQLKIQYRMNEDIVLLANELVYQGQLSTGSVTVAKQKLFIPLVDSYRDLVNRLHQSTELEWLLSVLNPERKVLFLDTDQVPAPEEVLDHQDSVKNTVESRIVSIICEIFCRFGIGEDQLGIISPQRIQLKAIQLACSSLGLDKIDIHTVDKYQGRDKDCIIVSLVRSNNAQNIGKLLRDWRRMNVAITRAKCKLIMIGSKSTLSSSPFFATLFEIAEKHGWEVKLPKFAHLHSFQLPIVT